MKYVIEHREAPMTRVDDLVDGLASEGITDSDGQIIVDQEAARRKLAESQLSDPNWYVLLLVQSAVLKGATRVDCSISASGLSLRFDGRPFSRSSLEQLFESPFVSGREPDLRARQELAFGLNTALSQKHRGLSVTSCDGETAHRLEIGVGESARLSTASPMAGTLIEVHHRGGYSHLKRVCQGYLRSRPEQRLLWERCRFADIELFVNGQSVAGGLHLPRATVTAPISGAGLRGEAGFVTGSGAFGITSTLMLVQNGVWIATKQFHQLPGLEARIRDDGFVAVIEADELRKDLSQVDFVQDEAFGAIAQPVSDAHGRCQELLKTAKSVKARTRDYPNEKGVLPQNDMVMALLFFATMMSFSAILPLLMVMSAASEGRVPALAELLGPGIGLGVNLIFTLALTLWVRRINGVTLDRWWFGLALPLTVLGLLTVLLSGAVTLLFGT